ncbi:uncharacterized protein YpmB [Evansella vedderi]|uniref:Uncharacterized protein YpmB n=1 Tax=Evansella vedderi TaxID=38282 RepID=A0ABU0A1S7_9BACI|nr:DUF5590 domain-containing protein [Evansella vedderi]MDQ0257437.1 uncharacterized protein YpmB [Evansella vedderi]
MKAWILSIITIIIVSVAGFAAYMYMAISDPLVQRQQAASSILEGYEAVAEIQHISYYHGRRSFQVIEGKNSDGDEVYVWVEELTEEQKENEEEPQIISRLKSEGLSKQEIRDLAHSRLDIKQIKSINLGIIGSTPVYEVIYEDQLNRHSFYYVKFEDGTYIRHYQFQKN